ncbi:RrF2 family transcriptional regulator [Coraliomargarita akajimensis]|uniref:Transcriptional regulator, BadM/Rrf2 family n=1 Tax=Coraliomargarita akajimensis (strain DSM 45221 / IAM 15411 / JCM 23193 / KCTC 12865 / 04OKA010-24) TaxID=583355 RepID=D5EKZ6_CORAD|nr:Rrf2 family transcriptional regulator [Coraliomargarita akajimensis]ADE53098.1 transcriptional regulator, BadM/Rrf2 family [Coraliomargarita akajimensis DSM 45221]
MFKYGKTAQNAISAMSYLAKVYDGGETKISSKEIAEERQLPQTLVAKLLVTLSQAGLVDGARGPNGGYWLAKAPKDIVLYDIVRLFEKGGSGAMCPFGPDWCGNGEPCPLHDQLVELDGNLMSFLERTSLAVFEIGSQAEAGSGDSACYI